MGSSFFKGKGGSHGPAITGGGNPGLEARAFGASSSAGRGSAIGSAKDLQQAQAIFKAGQAKPQKRSAAYPAGPKL